MVFPILNRINETIMIVEVKKQLESEQEDASGKRDHSLDSHSGDPSNIDGMSSKAPTHGISITKGGFTIQEEFALKLFLEFLKKKVETAVARKEAISKRNTGSNIISVIDEIMSQKTHTKLIKKLKEVLPPFFGFKDVGVLLSDRVTREAAEEKAAKAITSWRELAKQQTLSSGNDLYTSLNLQNVDSNLIGLDANSVVRFPNSLGITGQVFKEKTVIARNQAKKEMKFNPTVDNITNQSDAQNFMIGVILGHKDVRAGVLQFINTSTGEDVKTYDIQRFKAMRGFLGSCAENVTYSSIAINMTLAVQALIEQLNKVVEHTDREQSERINAFDIVEKQLAFMFREILAFTKLVNSKKEE